MELAPDSSMTLRLSKDTKLRLFGPFLLFAFGTFFFRIHVYITSTPRQIIQFVCIALVCGYIGWELARRLIRYVQKHYPGLPQTRRRLLILGILTLLLANFNASLRILINWLLHVGIWNVDAYDYIETTGIQLVYACVYMAVYEGQYLIWQWQKTYQEKEKLIKAEWQARFDSLKNQVNPHFLFNALNSLSTLIDESPVQANLFVDELSKVYRYLLQSNDQALTSLETELQFIKSYSHLLQTRHGAGFVVRTSVPGNCLGYSLPPLTLQLLVENAVKHNSMMPERPLIIDIAITTLTDNQQQDCMLLMVRNNLQRKNKRGLSNGVGLANIAAKYQMLTSTQMVIEEDEHYFTVLLPLLTSLEATPI